MPRRTPEEEEQILTSIEEIAENLSEQVGELQSFLKELKAARNKKTGRRSVPEGLTGAQYG